MDDEHFKRSIGRHIFGSDPAGYQAGRLDYPQVVYEILQRRCGLKPGVAVFEIGPGTGQATSRLLDLGITSLTAIEPDPQLAAHLVANEPRRWARLRVITSSFEAAPLPESAFELGVAATSFHWLEPAAALAKIRRLLRPGGWWSMWWNVFRSPPGEDRFDDETRDLFDDLDLPPSFKGSSHYALDEQSRIAELQAAGFGNISFELIRTEIVMTPADLRALYATFSAIRRLAEDERRRRLDAFARIAAEMFGERVPRTLLTPIYAAQRL